MAFSTRQLRLPDGQRRTVPAHVGAPPRLRGGLADWLDQRHHAPLHPEGKD